MKKLLSIVFILATLFSQAQPISSAPVDTGLAVNGKIGISRMVAGFPKLFYTTIDAVSKTNAFFTGTGFGLAFSPVDATTYYEGVLTTASAPATTVNQHIFAVPTNCTLVGYSIATVGTGASATGESSTVSVRINNTTDVQLSNAVTFNATANTVNTFVGMALATDLSSGDKWEIKWLTPTWATNPTGAQLAVTLYFRVR